MKSGKLRWTVTIQSKTNAQNPNSGAMSPTWSDFVTGIRADMVPVARRGSKAAWEALIAQQTVAQRVIQFDIRYYPGIDETMRVIDPDGGVWDIKTIIDVDTRHVELWLICEKGISLG
jgi:head-tail adaptor